MSELYWNTRATKRDEIIIYFTLYQNNAVSLFVYVMMYVMNK